jgi:hypothetical protein
MSTLRALRRRGLWFGIPGAILVGASGCDTAAQVLDTIALALSIVEVWV